MRAVDGATAGQGNGVVFSIFEVRFTPLSRTRVPSLLTPPQPSFPRPCRRVGALFSLVVPADMEQEPSEGQVKELQAFMETENQKAVIQAAISKLTDICFEKCITKPGSKLDSSEANCVANCAGRFLDSSVFVVNRMMQKRQGPQ